MIEIGLPYINGYKPAFNYQKMLKQVVLKQVVLCQDLIAVVDRDAMYESIKFHQPDWGNVLEDAPVLRDKANQHSRSQC